MARFGLLVFWFHPDREITVSLFFMPYNKCYIDQHSSVSVDKNISTAKRELRQYPAILTSRLVNETYICAAQAIQGYTKLYIAIWTASDL